MPRVRGRRVSFRSFSSASLAPSTSPAIFVAIARACANLAFPGFAARPSSSTAVYLAAAGLARRRTSPATIPDAVSPPSTPRSASPSARAHADHTRGLRGAISAASRNNVRANEMADARDAPPPRRTSNVAHAHNNALRAANRSSCADRASSFALAFFRLAEECFSAESSSAGACFLADACGGGAIAPGEYVSTVSMPNPEPSRDVARRLFAGAEEPRGFRVRARVRLQERPRLPAGRVGGVEDGRLAEQSSRLRKAPLLRLEEGPRLERGRSARIGALRVSEQSSRFGRSTRSLEDGPGVPRGGVVRVGVARAAEQSSGDSRGFWVVRVAVRAARLEDGPRLDQRGDVVRGDGVDGGEFGSLGLGVDGSRADVDGVLESARAVPTPSTSVAMSRAAKEAMCALVGKRRRPLRRSLSAPAKSPSRSSDLAAYTTFTSGRCPPGCLPAYRALPLSLASRARRGVGLEIVRGRRAGGGRKRRARPARAETTARTNAPPRRSARRRNAIPSRGATRARRARSARGTGSARGRNPVPARTRKAPPAPTRAPRTSRRGAEAERRRRPRECASYPSSHEDECATRGARAPAADQIDDRGASVEGASASFDANRFGFEERESLSTPDQLSYIAVHPKIGTRTLAHGRLSLSTPARGAARDTRARAASATPTPEDARRPTMTPSEPAGEDTARDGTRDDVRDAVAESHRATDATTRASSAS